MRIRDIITESAMLQEHQLVFKKNKKTGNLTLKWRCESGPREGRTVPVLAQCSAAPDLKKSSKMKQTRKKSKVSQARKAKKTKRVDPIVKVASRLNKLSKNKKK